MTERAGKQDAPMPQRASQKRGRRIGSGREVSGWLARRRRGGEAEEEEEEEGWCSGRGQTTAGGTAGSFRGRVWCFGTALLRVRPPVHLMYSVPASGRTGTAGARGKVHGRTLAALDWWAVTEGWALRWVLLAVLPV